MTWNVATFHILSVIQKRMFALEMKDWKYQDTCRAAIRAHFAKIKKKQLIRNCELFV